MSYSTAEVARLLEEKPQRIRYLVRIGVLQPKRNFRGHFLFSFQDLILLRTARELLGAGISPKRIGKSLEKLRLQLDGKPLTAVQILARGSDVAVREGDEVWQPASGQILFNFEIDDLARKVESLEGHRSEVSYDLTADQWFDCGCELESEDPTEAIKAYRKALAADQDHVESLLNLGRLLHERKELEEAEECYRSALKVKPGNPIAHYNLGVVLEDRSRPEESVASYQRSLECDPYLVDAHFNLARLFERKGERMAALKHLKAYRQLSSQ